MSFRTLLDARTPRPRAAPRRPATRLRLEPLDDRALPSAYVQADLVSDQARVAPIHDPELIDAWGIALNSAATGAFWISAHGTGLSTLYSGDVTRPDGTLRPLTKGALTVTVPGGAPTGQVFNAPATGNEDFFVSAVDSDGNVDRAPSRFITVSDTGVMTGWAASVPSVAPPPPPPAPPSRVAHVTGTTEGAAYTGLAIATVGTADFLYAADFRNGEIDVFNGDWAPTTLAGDFVDPNAPDGYAPFNIQNLGGKLYVAYAQQDADDLPDKGHGFVSVFDTGGNFLNRLVTHDHLKAPWGLALAPANFGELSNSLLVANHGDGRINAYDPTTGAHIDRVRGTDGEPIKIDGLMGLHFGNGINSGDPNALYFTAGPDGGAHGLFGSLRVAPPAAAAIDGAAARGSTGETAPLLSALTGTEAGGVISDGGSDAGGSGTGTGGDEPAPAAGSLAGDASAGDVAEVADDGADVSALDVFGGASVLEDDPLELG